MAEETTSTTTTNTTENTTKNKKGFKAWLLALLGFILGAIGTFFLCKRNNNDLRNVRGGLDDLGNKLDTTQATIDSARENTQRLGASIGECEQRANECEEILKRIRGQHQQ